MFYGSMNPEIALEWIDSKQAMLVHVGYHPELWVHVATEAM